MWLFNMVILSYTYLGGQDASNDDSDDNDITTMTDLGGRGWRRLVTMHVQCQRSSMWRRRFTDEKGNLGRSYPSRHLQLHARFVPIRSNFIISHIKSHYWWGFQVSVFNHLLIWFDFSEYIVYWLKGPVEPLSSSIDDFWSDEGHTYWLASPKLDLVRPLILSKNQSVPVSSTKDLSGAQLKDSYSILLRAADASLTDFSLFVSILTNDQFVPGWVFPSLPTLS